MYNQNFHFSYSPSENVKWLLVNVYIIRWNNIAEKLFLSSNVKENEKRALFNSLRMFYLLIRPSLIKQGKSTHLDKIFYIKQKENGELEVEDKSFENMTEFIKAYGMLLHTASVELGLNIDVKLEVSTLDGDSSPVKLDDFER